MPAAVIKLRIHFKLSCAICDIRVTLITVIPHRRTVESEQGGVWLFLGQVTDYRVWLGYESMVLYCSGPLSPIPRHNLELHDPHVDFQLSISCLCYIWQGPRTPQTSRLYNARLFLLNASLPRPSPSLDHDTNEEPAQVSVALSFHKVRILKQAPQRDQALP